MTAEHDPVLDGLILVGADVEDLPRILSEYGLPVWHDIGHAVVSSCSVVLVGELCYGVI
jgi:hypothetical protein